MRMAVVACVVALCVACGGDDDDIVECSVDGDCLQGGVAGECLPSPSSSKSWCAFPDPACATDQRWGLLSGDDLAGTCVDPLPGPDAGPDASVPDAMQPEPDAGPTIDAAPGPDAMPGTWTDPSELIGVTGGDTGESHPNLSTDGLTLHFSSSTSGSGVGSEIFVATRSSLGMAFTVDGPVTEFNTADNETAPHMSPNMLELYFVRTPSGTLNDQIMRSTRGSPAAAWNLPASTGLVGRSPALTGDGLTMYFVTPTNVLRRSTRASLGAAWGAPEDVAISPAPSSTMLHVDVSDDDLTLLLSRASGSATPPFILTCTRADTASPFTDCTELPMNPPPLADDGTDVQGAEFAQSETELYFAGRTSTVLRLFVSAFVE